MTVERDNARNNAMCTQARKTTHGLDGHHQHAMRHSGTCSRRLRAICLFSTSLWSMTAISSVECLQDTCVPALLLRQMLSANSWAYFAVVVLGISVCLRIVCCFGEQTCTLKLIYFSFFTLHTCSVAEWLACWTQAQKDPGSNRSRDAVG